MSCGLLRSLEEVPGCRLAVVAVGVATLTVKNGRKRRDFCKSIMHDRVDLRFLSRVFVYGITDSAFLGPSCNQQANCSSNASHHSYSIKPSNNRLSNGRDVQIFRRVHRINGGKIQTVIDLTIKISH